MLNMAGRLTKFVLRRQVCHRFGDGEGWLPRIASNRVGPLRSMCLTRKAPNSACQPPKCATPSDRAGKLHEGVYGVQQPSPRDEDDGYAWLKLCIYIYVLITSVWGSRQDEKLRREGLTSYKAQLEELHTAVREASSRGDAVVMVDVLPVLGAEELANQPINQSTSQMIGRKSNSFLTGGGR